MTIHILDRTVADRIAAGEVVERPASIVKELVENSLDAGATAISVELREGGLSLIRVGDNGSGMTRADAPLSVARFATSKLTTERDLQSIRTLGFRGEALPSIAAVSRFELLTRARDEIQGTRIRIHDGQTEIEVAGAPIGTLVTARELFYNTPARKKFLKSPLRETELVTLTVVRYALAFPHIAFRIAVDGKESLAAPAASPLERLAAVWGREAASSMLPVAYDSFELKVHGFVSHPTFARASREWQNFYVNGRPIRSGLLAVMLERPYGGRLPPNRHPLAVLNVELDPVYVDVNVHPRKAEVRFFQERSIYGAVQAAVEQALRDIPAPAMQVESASVAWPFAGTAEAAFPDAPTTLRESQAEYTAGSWRALGQVHNTYLLAQTPDGLAIADQHAAHEQVLFEQLTTAPASVPVEPPLIVTLLPREAALVAAHLDAYAALGFALEPFGEDTFRLDAAPSATLLGARPAFDIVVQEHLSYRDLDGDLLSDRLASKLACASALKAGDALTLAQQQQLLDDLIRIYSPATCPHGRPTFIHVTLSDLDRRFLRR